MTLLNPHLRLRTAVIMVCSIVICCGCAKGQVLWQMVHDELNEVERELEAEEVSQAALDSIAAKNIARGWRENITATIFWVGEKACRANPVHNRSSSWDRKWMTSFGGVDTPYKRSGYNPKSFKPKMNPFYIALPYNDIAPKGVGHKQEAAKVIWWYAGSYVSRYRSVCKGRWVAIRNGDKVCYAQWEDCGPFVTDDWEYMFQGKKPKKNRNDNAGIDLSPAIRDYLGLTSGEKVAWKFVEEYEVKQGPWRKWLSNNSLLTTNP